MDLLSPFLYVTQILFYYFLSSVLLSLVSPATVSAVSVRSIIPRFIFLASLQVRFAMKQTRFSL
jgi:hypothetical protein